MKAKLSEYKEIHFDKRLRGYDPAQVDQYVNNLLRFCQVLWNQVNVLEKKITFYEERKTMINKDNSTAEEGEN